MRNSITNINTAPNGLALNSGLGTMSEFSLATKVPAQFNETTTIKYTKSENSSNDYLSDNGDTSQFSVNSGVVLVDGQSYDNNFIARHCQFIAPLDCYIKSINGFINTNNGAECGEESFILSVWKKSSSIGVTSTAINLLFRQTFVFNASSNSNVLSIDGSTDSKVGDKTYKIPAKEGVMVSIKRGASEGADLIINGNFLTATNLNGWSVSSAGGFFLSKGLNLNSRLIKTERGTVYSACTQVGSIFEIGKTYKLVIEGLNITSGSIELKFGRSHNTNPPRPILTSSNNGTYEDTFIVLNQNDGFTINSNGNTVASLSSISIKEVSSTCHDINAKFTTIIETIDNQATLDDFKLNTISVARNRYDNTVSNPNAFNLPKKFNGI